MSLSPTNSFRGKLHIARILWPSSSARVVLPLYDSFVVASSVFPSSSSSSQLLEGSESTAARNRGQYQWHRVRRTWRPVSTTGSHQAAPSVSCRQVVAEEKLQHRVVALEQELLSPRSPCEQKFFGKSVAGQGERVLGGIKLGICGRLRSHVRASS